MLSLDAGQHRAVIAGRKTRHSVPVRRRHGIRLPAPCGPGDLLGSSSSVFLEVLTVQRGTLGDVTDTDARAEGFVAVGGRSALELWREAWVHTHDTAWRKRELVDLAACFGEDVVPWILARRFEQRWTHTEHYAVTFRVAGNAPAYYLGRQGRCDYTRDPRDAIDDLPVADPEYVEARAAQAAAEGERQRASFREELEAERAARKTARDTARADVRRAA